MKETGLHPALREMRSHFSDPATLFVLGVVAAVLTLVAPFGTNETLTTGFRALYWLVIVLTTYTAGFGVDILLRPHLAHRLAQAVNPFVVGGVVTCVVVCVNLLLMGRVPGGPSWVTDLLTIYVIAALVAAAMQAIMTSLARQTPRTESETPEPPAILDRLPLEKRGDLVALSVEDHYVRVRTTRGEEMILMRLSDAIRETSPEAGLRVHRSHWVALAQVASARRDGDRAILGMVHGDDIPVSRTHIPAIREAGLLPK